MVVRKYHRSNLSNLLIRVNKKLLTQLVPVQINCNKNKKINLKIPNPINSIVNNQSKIKKIVFKKLYKLQIIDKKMTIVAFQSSKRLNLLHSKKTFLKISVLKTYYSKY